jgi:hypothetical protein
VRFPAARIESRRDRTRVEDDIGLIVGFVDHGSMPRGAVSRDVSRVFLCGGEPVALVGVVGHQS